MKSFNNNLYFLFSMTHEFDETELKEAKRTLEQLAEHRLFGLTESDKRSTDRHAEDFINSLDTFGMSYEQSKILKKYYEEAKTKAIEANI